MHTGSLTFWLSCEVIEQWVSQQKTGRRGASNTYSSASRLKWRVKVMAEDVL
ncbi:MAG: hypothetical protein F6K08_30900 [Okeania sp. SIO1H6]|nr:hypothetical protein [Okeania sp. SIO1H6]